MPSPTPSASVSTTLTDALRKLAERWAGAQARERANYQLYLGELCTVLDVEGPRPAGSGYEYEFPVKVINRDGKETSNFVDLFKRDHFVLEAKDKEAGRSDELMLRKAYGQARSYITHLPGTTPPYLIILDVAKTMMIWDRWEGGFGGFGAGRRIDLPTLHERAPDINSCGISGCSRRRATRGRERRQSPRRSRGSSPTWPRRWRSAGMTRSA